MISILLSGLLLTTPATQPSGPMDAFRETAHGAAIEACGDVTELAADARAGAARDPDFTAVLDGLGEPPALPDALEFADLKAWVWDVRLQTKVGLCAASVAADEGDTDGEMRVLVDVAEHLQRASGTPVAFARSNVDQLRAAVLTTLAEQFAALDPERQLRWLPRIASLPESTPMVDILRGELRYLKDQGHPLFAHLDPAVFEDFIVDAGPILTNSSPATVRQDLFAAASRFTAGEHDPAAELIIGHVTDGQLVAQDQYHAAAEAERRLRELVAE